MIEAMFVSVVGFIFDFFFSFIMVIVLMFLDEYILVNSLLFTVNIKICVVIIFVYLFNLI